MIPYELFAGDGMLTRLLLKASDKAPWSDNGDAKNPALSPLGENVRSLTSSEQMVLKLTALQSMSMVTKTVNQIWTTS
ncbi:cell wall surface anchor family protein [Streptococcus pneumoniae]|nr:cell wall surface anchor family protein [Streptococcus pneumoniae]